MLTGNSNQGFQDVVDSQILTGHRASAATKLKSLDELFDFCRMISRSRGAAGEITLRANGDVWWSGAHEREWQSQEED
ncbi:MAG: hypothetical protein WBP11_13305 [Dokdonella sp.]